MYTAEELKKELDIKENTLKMYNKTRMEMLLRGANNEDCEGIEDEIRRLKDEIRELNKEIVLTSKIGKMFNRLNGKPYSRLVYSSDFDVIFPKEYNIYNEVLRVHDNTDGKILEIVLQDSVYKVNGKTYILGKTINEISTKTFDIDVVWYDTKGDIAYKEKFHNCKIVSHYKDDGRVNTDTLIKNRTFHLYIEYESLTYETVELEIKTKSSLFDKDGNISIKSNSNAIISDDVIDPFITRIYW